MTEKMKPSGIAWIGDIPQDWKCKRYRFCGNVQYGYPFNSDYFSSEETGFPLIRIRDITSGEIATYYEGTYPSEYVVQSGDVLIGMDGDFNVRIWKNRDALLNQRCCRVFDSQQISKRFMAYYLPHYLKVINDLTWSTTVKHLLADDINNIYVSYPGMREQQAIADFLDTQCAKIDSVIADIEKQIETLKQYKQSLIYESTVVGLKKEVTKRASDIDWINISIPEQWKTKKIRYLFQLRDERNYRSLEEVNLISLYTDLGVVQHSDLETTTGNKAYTADGYKKVYKDDIVVNIILCWMGAIGISDYEGVTSPAYDVYLPIDKKTVYPRYYHYLFKSERFHGKCYTVGRGIMAMRWRTYSSEFKNIDVPLPTYDEQVEIASFLDKKCKEIDAIIQTKQSQRDIIAQHKKSLIYEYVTGKKRVTEVN